MVHRSSEDRSPAELYAQIWQLQQWSRVFMDAADPFVIEDMSGSIIDMNGEAEREYGWQRGELRVNPSAA